MRHEAEVAEVHLVAHPKRHDDTATPPPPLPFSNSHITASLCKCLTLVALRHEIDAVEVDFTAHPQGHDSAEFFAITSGRESQQGDEEVVVVHLDAEGVIFPGTERHGTQDVKPLSHSVGHAVTDDGTTAKMEQSRD